MQEKPISTEDSDTTQIEKKPTPATEERPIPPIEEGQVSQEQLKEIFQENRYITTKQLAYKLHISRQWISDLCKTGRIKAVKPVGGHWRIPESEANKMLTQGLPAAPRPTPPRPTIKMKITREHAKKIMPERRTEEEPEEETKKEKPWDFLDPFGLVR